MIDWRNLKFKWDFIEKVYRYSADPKVAFAIVSLTSYSAVAKVGTYYSDPTDGGLKNDDRLWRLSGLTKGQWGRIKETILVFFNEKDGFLFPPEEWFDCGGKSGFDRPAIPAGIRSYVMQRDNFRCVYCGDDTGPFDLDHVVPIARGGHATDKENLVCACVSCNRSKGAKTVEEWRQ